MGADASQYVGRTVVLRNDHGKHLQYSGSAFAASPNQGGWEQWTLEKAAASADGKVTHVYLNCAAHDIRLSASDNRKALTASKNRSAWEQWQLISAGSAFYLQSHHGTYLNQGSDGNLLQSNNKGGSELWIISLVGGTPAPAPAATHHHHTPAPAPPPAPTTPTGRFYLTDGHSRQLSCSDNGTLSGSSNKAGWEVWTVSDAGGGKVVIGSCHGTNLQVADTGVVGTSRNRGGWEQFNLTAAGGGKYYIVGHTGNHVGNSGSAYYCSNRNTGGWEQWTLTPA